MRHFLFLLLVLTLSMPDSATGKWLFGATESFEISSNTSERRTKLIIEDFQLVQAVFKQLNPGLSGATSRRLRVVICKDDKTMDMIVPLYNGKPKELGGMFSRDYEGDYILINLEGDFEQSKTIVYHEFVHFLVNKQKVRLPAWLSEGLAEVFSTIEPSGKKKVVIGNPPYGNVNVLLDRKMIPLDRLFRISHASSEYNSDDHGRGVFYAQSWALVHYFMFGNTDLPKDAYERFVSAILKEHYLTEDRFIDIVGINYKEMEKRLDRYIRTGRYYMSKPDRPEIEGTDNLDLRSGKPGEENLVIGSILLSTRGPSAGAGYILSAYKELPDSSDASAYMGYLNYKNENSREADHYFSEAIERGSDSPATYLWNAIARLRTLNPQGSVNQRSLDIETTVKLMRLLFKAR